MLTMGRLETWLRVNGLQLKVVYHHGRWDAELSPTGGGHEYEVGSGGTLEKAVNAAFKLWDGRDFKLPEGGKRKAPAKRGRKQVKRASAKRGRVVFPLGYDVWAITDPFTRVRYFDLSAPNGTCLGSFRTRRAAAVEAWADVAAARGRPERRKKSKGGKHKGPLRISALAASVRGLLK